MTKCNWKGILWGVNMLSLGIGTCSLAQPNMVKAFLDVYNTHWQTNYFTITLQLCIYINNLFNNATSYHFNYTLGLVRCLWIFHSMSPCLLPSELWQIVSLFLEITTQLAGDDSHLIKTLFDSPCYFILLLSAILSSFLA